MWRYFRGFGPVVDVFVPQKKTKAGNSFGFVRFKEVRNEQKLIDAISTAWAGSGKLFVHKARFERPKDVTVSSRSHLSVAKQYHVVPGWKSLVSPIVHGKPSYVVVAQRSTLLHVDAARTCDEDVQWLSRCLLAEAKDCDILSDIRNLLCDAGFSQVKPKYVGGLRVLLDCSSVEVAQ